MKDGLGGGTGIAGISEEITLNTVISGGVKLHFRDTGLYLQSDSGGNLLVKSDTTVTLDGAAASGAAINLKLSGNKDGSASVQVEDSDTFPVIKLDSAGNVKGKGSTGKL